MKRKKLLILGAGQYGHVAWETAEAMESFDTIAFLDDHNPTAVGKLMDFKNLHKEYDCAFVAIGNPQLRLQLIDMLEQYGFELPILIHPKAYVSPSAKIAMGSIVEPMAVVNTAAVIEKGGLICAGCVVNHNAHVLPGCQIDCNAVVASNATVPEGKKVACGSVFEKNKEME